MANGLGGGRRGEIRASLRGVLATRAARARGRGRPAALDLVRSERPELVLLDVWMPEVDGIELLRSLQTSRPAAGDHDLRPRQHRDCGAGDQARRVRLHREAVLDRRLLQVVNRALEHRALLRRRERRPHDGAAASWPCRRRRTVAAPSATIGRSVIASGHGLHSGIKSGLILIPLPAGRGIVFANLTTAATVPAHLDYVDSTGYATTLHAPA
jgi:hypothetical protein